MFNSEIVVIMMYVCILGYIVIHGGFQMVFCNTKFHVFMYQIYIEINKVTIHQNQYLTTKAYMIFTLLCQALSYHLHGYLNHILEHQSLEKD